MSDNSFPYGKAARRKFAEEKIKDAKCAISMAREEFAAELLRMKLREQLVGDLMEQAKELDQHLYHYATLSDSNLAWITQRVDEVLNGLAKIVIEA